MTPFRMSLSRRAVLSWPLLAALPALASEVRAETTDGYPSKPIRIIVPFAPGGSGDITARLVGKYIEDKTGQPFVVENKPGANGIVGVLAVKAAAADGYTLMLATTSTNAANIHMFKNPGYDPEKDFTVVGVIGSSGAFLVVPADSPHKTLSDLLTYAKANPGKLNFGYFNASSQVPAEVLATKAAVQWQGVAYKAIGNAWTDLYCGRHPVHVRRPDGGPRPGGGQTRRGRWRSPCPSAARSIPRCRRSARPSPASPAPASWRSPCPRRRRGRSRRG